MNFIDTSKNGGHPLYLEDIEFVQQSYKEAIAGITSSLGADSYILSGCDKTLQSAGVWAISKGFVVLDKEVFYVPDHTVSFLDENDPLYFDVEQSYVSPSPVNYKKTGSQNVHIQRQAVITSVATDYEFKSLPKMFNVIDHLIRGDAGFLEASHPWNGSLAYRVAGGLLHLSGALSVNAIGIDYSGNNILEIPLQYLPYRDGSSTLTYGAHHPLIDMIDSAKVLYNGAHRFVVPVTRQNLNLETISVGSAIAEVWADLSNPVLEGSGRRRGYLRIFDPGGWTNGFRRIYKFSGVSWLIAP